MLVSSTGGLINSLPLPLVDLNHLHFNDMEIDFCRRSKGYVARKCQIQDLTQICLPEKPVPFLLPMLNFDKENDRVCLELGHC